MKLGGQAVSTGARGVLQTLQARALLNHFLIFLRQRHLYVIYPCSIALAGGLRKGLLVPETISECFLFQGVTLRSCNQIALHD